MPYSDTRLANGVRVIVVPDPSLTLTAVDVWVRAGSAFEMSNEIGAAHCLEHTIFRGTSKRKPGQLDYEMESIGASLNASTSRDWARFYTTVATDYLDTALDVLSDALINPLLGASQLESEKKVIVAEISQRNIDPPQILDNALCRELFQNHTYANPVFGTEESIESINPQTLRSFHKRAYTGEAMTLILVGNITKDEVLKKAEKSFSKVPKAPALPWPKPPAPPPAYKTIDLPKAEDGSEWAAIGFIGPGMDSPSDVWAMDTLISALVRRQSGILWDSLVISGKIAKSLDTTFLTSRLPPLVSINIACEAGKADQCLNTIKTELSRIAQMGIPDSDLVAAKRYLLGTNAFQLETASGLSGSYGFYSVISDPSDSVNYARNINSVTNDDIRRVTSRYLDSSRAVMVRMIK